MTDQESKPDVPSGHCPVCGGEKAIRCKKDGYNSVEYQEFTLERYEKAWDKLRWEITDVWCSKCGIEFRWV